MVLGRPFSRSAAIAAALALAAVSCGNDDDPATTTAPSSGSPPVTVASVPGESVPMTTGSVTTGSVTTGSVSTIELPDACVVVPTADVATATELAVDDGVPAGDERRRVCTFQDQDNGVGITVGIEGGGRFDEKAEASRRSLEVDGEEIDSLGDRALYFFSDEDRPEGVGGVLVGVGDLTIEVTMQGLPDDAMREASVSIAELAVSNL